MPGRTRRVRLIAVAVCIVTVFFLYERNAARVNEVADWTRNTVGGGAVLRPDQKEKNAEALNYAPEPEPPYRPQSASTTRHTTSSSTFKQMTDSPTTTSSYTSSSSHEAYVSPTSTPGPTLPKFYGDDPEPSSSSRRTTSRKTSSRQHWTKLPERFPITSTIQLPTGSPTPIPRIQKQGGGSADKERLAKIREACRHAWNGFRQEGWNYDEVRPVSGGGQNSFNGWGATLVDSLDTLWIMGMKEEFEEAVNKTAQIDFTYSSRHDIPLFEVTIRYLGGMLGAFDVSGRKYRVLLDKAVELAEVLYSAFDTPNRMPETYYNWAPAFASNPHRASTRAVMAEIGTLSLEFTRLAQLTFEPKYYDAVARITDEFEKWQNNTRLPGMWPTDLDASGCAKPIRKPATPTKPKPKSSLQMPIPGSEDSYMTSGEPVQASKNLLSKAQHTLDELAEEGGGTRKMGSVANPAVGGALGGLSATASNLRHSMNDDPWKKQDSPIHDDTTNHAGAHEPLAPDAGSSDSGVRLENPLAGKRPSDPLLPNAGGASHQKRQLDDLDPTPEETVQTDDLTDESFHQPSKKDYDFDSDMNDSDIDDPFVDEPDEPEDECEDQGFMSVSSYAHETFTLGGKSDSTFEYLPKEYLLLGGRLEQYKNMYLESMKPVIEKLIFRPMTIGNLDILVSGEVVAMVNFTTKKIGYEHNGRLEHLTCFAGGMFAMGGKLFDLPEHVEIGRKLTDGCVWAYNSTNSGIMPDGATLLVCEDKENCKWNETAWYDSLDAVGAESRQQQIDDWKTTYEVDDIPAWKKQKAIEEAEEEAEISRSAAAALAAATAYPSNEYGDEVPDSVPDVHAGLHHLRKRQLDESSEVNAPRPQPQPSPTASITDAWRTSAHTDEDVEDGSAIMQGLSSMDGPYDSDPYSVPTPTTPVRPQFTPYPPPSHDEYVKTKIEEDRIPPGFSHVGGTGYILRPEAIESVFYMYRITGEQYWRDVGWKMFLAIETATRSEYGHSSLDDVTKTHPRRTDKMESFWIAETLKYFYLLFDDPDTWSLDDWVLNTEAHFFARPKVSPS